MSDAEKYRQLIRGAKALTLDDGKRFLEWFEKKAIADGVDPELVAEIVKDWNDG